MRPCWRSRDEKVNLRPGACLSRRPAHPDRVLRVALLWLCLPLLGANRPSVGAIRWDAWSGGAVTSEVERTLGPAPHRWRLPWFAEIDAAGQAHLHGDAPGVMEQEIAYARDAGLDYWAFLTYPAEDGMSSALARYLASPRRGELGFCLILHQTFGVPAERWPAERDRVLRLLQEKGYQRVLGRPLVYVFGVDLARPSVAPRWAELRAAARTAGLDPYFVYMGWDPAKDYAAHAAEGFAAVSAYAHPGPAQTFARYVDGFERHAWASAHQTRTPYVPLVTTGWDKRPRQDHPVSWEKAAAYLSQPGFPATPTPEEIAAHLARALAFATTHAETCPAQTVIIYAWNEHDEGGWLCPTWTPEGRPDRRRLEAIRKVLKP